MYQDNGYNIADVMPTALDSGLFVSLVTIQEPSGNLNISGAPDDVYLDVAGLVNLVCMDAPESDARIRAEKTKLPEYVESEQIRHVLLGGYYEMVTEGRAWRAWLRTPGTDPTGGYYDIRGVESDSQSQMTRLKLALITV